MPGFSWNIEKQPMWWKPESLLELIRKSKRLLDTSAREIVARVYRGTAVHRLRPFYMWRVRLGRNNGPGIYIQTVVRGDLFWNWVKRWGLWLCQGKL